MQAPVPQASATSALKDYRIWGRIERGPYSFRAIVAAVPMEPGAGPDARDIREKVHSRSGIARETLHALSHQLAMAIHARGDRVVRIDVQR